MNLDSFVMEIVDKIKKGDLPPRFDETTVTFQGKCARDYIARNAIPVFCENTSDPLALSFRDFWDYFFNAFHKFTYESFPAGERLYALEKYTEGAAQIRVQAFRNSGMNGYVDCVHELFMRFGRAGATMEEVKAQLSFLKPTGFTRGEVDHFLASVSTCRIKLITLGEPPASAAYAAAIATFSRLPNMAMSTFTSMFCNGQDFRVAARGNPEAARAALNNWINLNLDAIEDAGKRAEGSETENPYAIFAAQATQRAAQAPTGTPAPKAPGPKKPAPEPKPQPQPEPEPESEPEPEEVGQEQAGGAPAPKGQKARFVAGSRRPPGRGNGNNGNSEGNHNNGGAQTEGNRKKYTNHKCNACQTDEHHWNRCPYSAKERKQKLLEQGRCFNCTSQGHPAYHCRSAGSCRNCEKYGIANAKHHTSICTKPQKDAPQYDGSQQVIPKQENPAREQNPEAAKRQKNQTVMAGLLQNAEMTPEQFGIISRALGLEVPPVRTI